MAALFSRRDDRRLKAAAFIVGLGCMGAVASPMIWVRTPINLRQYSPPQQPVQFDHRHHVGDLGIDCRFCHHLAFDSAVAGVPPTALCMQCHNQVWNNAPQLEPVRASATSGEPLHWQRVHRLPEHVHFHHAAHVQRGVGCAECHGDVGQMPAVWQEAPLTMSWCLDCHRDPAPHLRPQANITDAQWITTRAEGEHIARDSTIEPPLHCSGCHR